MHVRAVGAVLLFMVGVQASADVTTVARWDFNQYAASGALTNPLASFGSGSASAVGLRGSIPVTGSISNLGGNNHSSDPTQPGTAWNTTNYAAQGTNDGLVGVQFNASTLGVTDGLLVSFDVRGSNTASRFIRLLYTLDGSTFTSAGLASDGLYEIGVGPVFDNGITFDLSSIAATRNNDNFGFRIVAAFAPGTNSYAAIANGSNYGTTGTLRYDMVTLSIPGPGSFAILVVASLTTRRRRRS